jgi:LacI family transcriptional regulator
MAGLTLEDIARQVGVSRSTVSRVVNGHPNVREDVRKRVLEVIEDTGYHPNAAARTLASQRSQMIGLVLPRTVDSFFTDPYFPQFTQGIAQACNQSDYTLGLFLAGTREDEEKLFPRVSRRGFLDGVLVQSGHGHIGERLTERLIQFDMPMVIVGRPAEPNGVSFIDVDNAEAAYSAVSHLSRLGYQRIATITGPATSTVGIDRKQGYLRALAERGRALEDRLVTEGDFTEAGGYFAMQRLLPASPDAVFAASDIMAIGAMRAIREARLRIPDDIAVVGFDDIPLAALSDPQLTTVRQHVYQFGISAVELLTDLIENGLTPRRRVIMATELVIRESCGAHRRR